MGDFVLPRWAVAGAANWVLDTGDQIPHASVFKFPSAGLTCERARDVAAYSFVVIFMVFAHGAFPAFGGSLADSVFRVNACTSFQNPRRKCTGPGRDAGPSNRETGNRLCRSGGRRRSRQ